MDVENLKNEYIEKKNKENEIERIRNLILHQFDYLINIESEIKDEYKNKCVKSILNFKEEFNNYFNKNGFKVVEGNPMIADFNGLEIILLKLKSKEYEEKYKLKIANEKEFCIELRIANMNKNIFLWEQTLEAKNDPVIDRENGREIIRSCNDINKLQKINRFLYNKRKEFSNLLNEVDSNICKYVYTVITKNEMELDYEEEYDTFEELFKSL